MISLINELNLFVLINIFYFYFFQYFEDYFRENINKRKLILPFDIDKKMKKIRFF